MIAVFKVKPGFKIMAVIQMNVNIINEIKLTIGVELGVKLELKM